MNRIATMLICSFCIVAKITGVFPPSDNVLRTCPHHSLHDFINRWRNVFPALGLNY